MQNGGKQPHELRCDGQAPPRPRLENPHQHVQGPGLAHLKKGATGITLRLHARTPRVIDSMESLTYASDMVYYITKA